MIKCSGLLKIVAIILFASVFSCAREKPLGEQICGYYYVLEHCEDTGNKVKFGDNLISFSLDESSSVYWGSIPTPLHLWGKGVAISKMVKVVLLEDDGFYMKLEDDISGFWSGVYNVKIVENKDGKQIVFFNNMRRVVIEEVTLSNYGDSICSGCKYEALNCN